MTDAFSPRKGATHQNRYPPHPPSRVGRGPLLFFRTRNFGAAAAAFAAVGSALGSAALGSTAVGSGSAGWAGKTGKGAFRGGREGALLKSETNKNKKDEGLCLCRLRWCHLEMAPAILKGLGRFGRRMAGLGSPYESRDFKNGPGIQVQTLSMEIPCDIRPMERPMECLWCLETMFVCFFKRDSCYLRSFSWLPFLGSELLSRALPGAQLFTTLGTFLLEGASEQLGSWDHGGRVFRSGCLREFLRGASALPRIPFLRRLRRCVEHLTNAQ